MSELMKDNPGTLAPIDLYEDAGVGTDDIGLEDMNKPFIDILQTNSPELNPDDPKYIPGATVGSIVNKATGDVTPGSEGLFLVPFHRSKTVEEWIPRSAGGGHVATHPVTALVDLRVGVNEKGTPLTKDGNELVETQTFVCWLPEKNTWGVISCTVTKLKMARTWNTLIKNYRIDGPQGLRPAPIYARVYHLTTVKESSKKTGNSYYNWRIDVSGPLEDPTVLDIIRGFRAALDQGLFSTGPQVPDNAENESVI